MNLSYVPLRPTPLVFQSLVARWAGREVRTTRCCMSLQVKFLLKQNASTYVHMHARTHPHGHSRVDILYSVSSRMTEDCWTLWTTTVCNHHKSIDKFPWLVNVLKMSSSAEKKLPSVQYSVYLDQWTQGHFERMNLRTKLPAMWECENDWFALTLPQEPERWSQRPVVQRQRSLCGSLCIQP